MDISFRRLTESDFPLILKWVESPHVKQWWDQDVVYTLDSVKKKYGEYVQGYKTVEGARKPISAYIIICDSKPIGYIQYYNAYDFPRNGEQMKNLPASLAALDLFIGEVTYTRQGIGSKAVSLFLDEIVFKAFDYALVDPVSQNSSAIKAYENAGFKTHNVSHVEGVCLMIKPNVSKDESRS